MTWVSSTDSPVLNGYRSVVLATVSNQNGDERRRRLRRLRRRVGVLSDTEAPCSLATCGRWHAEGNIVRVENRLRMKTVGRRNVQSPDIWEAVAQLTDTAERLRGTRFLVPRGVHRFRTFQEAHEWMLEKMASTHASHGRKISRKSAKR